MLEDIGITINLIEMPEYKEYAKYYLNRNTLMRFYLQIFKRAKVKELRFQSQCALLNEVLEKRIEKGRKKKESANE